MQLGGETRMRGDLGLRVVRARPSLWERIKAWLSRY